MSKRILITGGHSTPAIACINELRSQSFREIFYIGQKKTILFDKNTSAEYRLITEKIKIPFKNLITGKFARHLSFTSLIWLLRLPIGFIQSLYFILTIRPNLVLTFGSHVGVPICFWASVFHIPIIAHEQTTTFGNSNIFIQKLASKICYSWPNTDLNKLADSNKAVLTGNPIRNEIKYLTFSSNTFDFADKSKPIILITGGNQGAHIINEWIFKNLNLLISKFNIIHQTGSNTLYDDFGKAKSIAENINLNEIKYIPQDYIFTEEMSEAFSKASFIIGRAGANSLIEFVVLNKKALLIPIPTTSGNEQFLNAQFVANIGLAIVLDQEKLDENDLLKSLDDLENLKINEEKRKDFANLHLDAEKRIVDLVISLIDKN